MIDDFFQERKAPKMNLRTALIAPALACALAADLPPGGRVRMKLAVTAPPAPGDYVLEIDMVHEGVTFFREKGSTPLRLPVRVE